MVKELYISKTLRDTIISKKQNSLSLLNFLRKSVTVEELLSDKDAQNSLNAILWEISPMGNDRVNGRHEKKVKGKNPYPAIYYLNYDPKNEDSGFIYDTFMLKGDPDHLYFFSKTSQGKPDSLEPLNEPLGRVIIGGNSNPRREFFNYGTVQWEYDTSIRINNISEGIIRRANGDLGAVEILLSRLPFIS